MFDSFVSYQARLRPHALALVTPERWATYGELDADVDRLATGLRALGVAPASGVVSIQVGDDYLRHVMMLALARLGVASSPSTDPQPDLRLNSLGEPDGPGVMRLSPDWLRRTFAADVAPLAPVARPLDGVGRVMLSSGTTSEPRRVPLTYRMIDSNIRSAAITYAAAKTGRWASIPGMDSMLGVSLSLSAWATGATFVAGLTPLTLAAQLDALKPTIVALAPVHLRQLLANLPVDNPVLPDLRLVMVGSVLPAPLALDARLRLSTEIQNAYGATECGCAIVGDAAMLEVHPGLIGAPVPGVEVTLVDEEGHLVGPGEQGEILIRSDRTAGAYLNDPEAAQRAFRYGGFMPGDLAHWLPDGQLVLDGRKDERLNLGGHKFLPNLMEDVALTCPGVADAAAFAVPDPQGIDRCWLAVVQGGGFSRDALAALIAAKGEALPPVRFAFTETIPRGPMGKVERDRLRRDTMAALGLPGA